MKFYENKSESSHDGLILWKNYVWEIHINVRLFQKNIIIFYLPLCSQVPKDSGRAAPIELPDREDPLNSFDLEFCERSHAKIWQHLSLGSSMMRQLLGVLRGRPGHLWRHSTSNRSVQWHLNEHPSSNSSPTGYRLHFEKNKIVLLNNCLPFGNRSLGDHAESLICIRKYQLYLMYSSYRYYFQQWRFHCLNQIKMMTKK